MTASAFISYSHADEKALDRLHKHLAVLQRDGSLAAWSDHEILAGSNLRHEIEAQLESSDLFIALVSPDYLASNYCYEVEFRRAQELAAAGKLRIAAIIIEPCDWLSTPLSEFLSLPKDGKPVSEWTNPNNAYLDVINQLRRLLQEKPKTAARAQVAPREPSGPARKVRLKRDFDAIDKAEFADRAYSAIREYFAAALSEIEQASEDIRTRMEDMGSDAFTCTLVNRARQRGGEVHITVHNRKGRDHFFGEISFVYERHAPTNTSHGGIRVEADEYQLYLVTERFMGSADEAIKYTPERAAEWLWNQFVERAGIEYE
ncbi:toll/interleukin-1 receptor domain-containing protein [Phenylobacterium sp.]|uniref:toll/interleukin-1 receptor domain-containing protein n=1 Tax=Phenylobacterium sp. TaxID=1871053 RepID=UPI003BACE167